MNLSQLKFIPVHYATAKVVIHGLDAYIHHDIKLDRYDICVLIENDCGTINMLTTWECNQVLGMAKDNFMDLLHANIRRNSKGRKDVPCIRLIPYHLDREAIRQKLAELNLDFDSRTGSIDIWVYTKEPRVNLLRLLAGAGTFDIAETNVGQL